ncbi:hypothetical protein OG978_42100 (plasmid) [Streptomyces sp. NBC_01591]|uniref:hypothetical protein n=1 Tax=Streptomyces sp. NBC_01591 TaxID=2975888 RepID=UPI002DDB783D|nr:hypothetical protein [Streptomyces sp. NBC_01591]WSD73796.1 hypothetical protein OG978_42100 [Streptomyces sp. NBC_01591]
MNPQTHIATDGYADAIPAPGTRWGTAMFDLIHSPADADRITPVYACTTGVPRIATAFTHTSRPSFSAEEPGDLVSRILDGRLVVVIVEDRHAQGDAVPELGQVAEYLFVGQGLVEPVNVEFGVVLHRMPPSRKS